MPNNEKRQPHNNILFLCGNETETMQNKKRACFENQNMLFLLLCFCKILLIIPGILINTV